jgi:hypothetical protein
MQQQIDTLVERVRLLEEKGAKQEQVTALARKLQAVSRIADAMESIATVFGEYHGTDGRKVPAIITAVFPVAGTVDIFVFDMSYSGGSYQLSGIEIGRKRGQVTPYLAPLQEEDEALEEAANDNLVAAQR